MNRSLFLAGTLFVAATLGACNPPRSTSDARPGATNPARTTLRLVTRAFAPGGEIPARHTCEGEDLSPPLAWSGAPEGTRSFALVVHDPDAPDPRAPKVDWVHWVVYDLPATLDSLSAGVTAATLPAGAREGSNDWNATGWKGPCPPIGRHRYVHELFALDVVLPDLGAANRATLAKAIEGHVLARAELIGTYEKHGGRPPSGDPPAAAAAGLVTGTVRHQDIEGGFFGIVGDDGARYDPLDLPAAFRVDGLRIRFRIVPAPGAAGTHMWGSIVHVADVAKAP